MDGCQWFIDTLRRNGVRLWAENGQLHYQAPRGALNQADLVRLMEYKEQIVALLENTSTPAAGLRLVGGSVRPGPAPLSFSQLAHWNHFRLSERLAVRQIAAALRLRGPLDIKALQASVSSILARHDALRTRFYVRDNTPIQEIAERSRSELEVVNLCTLSEPARSHEIERQIENLITDPVNVATGPLFGVRLLKLDSTEHVLIVAMEHLISDAVSREILLRDLLATYAQECHRRIARLPVIPVQFIDYARWQRTAYEAWLQTGGARRLDSLRASEGALFSVTARPTEVNGLGRGAVPLIIPRDLKRGLLEWCRTNRTTLPMCLFSAYTALVMRWCDTSQYVMRYQTDGRLHPEIEHTMGYFASVLYVCASSSRNGMFADLVAHLTQEYCEAYEDCDFSSAESLRPTSEFVRNAGFNWVPRAQAAKAATSADELVCSPVRFRHPMLRNLERHRDLDSDAEPVLLLYDGEHDVRGNICFSRNRITTADMERFARTFLLLLYQLRQNPLLRLRDVVAA